MHLYYVSHVRKGRILLKQLAEHESISSIFANDGCLIMFIVTSLNGRDN